MTLWEWQDAFGTEAAGEEHLFPQLPEWELPILFLYDHSDGIMKQILAMR